MRRTGEDQDEIMLNQKADAGTTEYASPCVLLLGGFDGLHIGHKKLLDCAKKYRLPVGIMTILGGKGKALFTLAERREIFARAGADFFFCEAFTEQFRNTDRETFLQDLRRRYNVRAFVCGEDFRFGKDAAGTPQFIREFAGIPVHAADILCVDGKKVGTSSVKEFLARGEVMQANRLLLFPFFLRGRVEAGRHVGHTYGFPTANLVYPKEKFPLKEGVYAVHADLEGKTYRGIANFGPCPTFGVEERKAEAYFDGFHGDLYGRTVDLVFDGYLREIRKFSGASALAAQLREDREHARQCALSVGYTACGKNAAQDTAPGAAKKTEEES